MGCCALTRPTAGSRAAELHAAAAAGLSSRTVTPSTPRPVPGRYTRRFSYATPSSPAVFSPSLRRRPAPAPARLSDSRRRLKDPTARRVLIRPFLPVASSFRPPASFSSARTLSPCVPTAPSPQRRTTRIRLLDGQTPVLPNAYVAAQPPSPRAETPRLQVRLLPFLASLLLRRRGRPLDEGWSSRQLDDDQRPRQEVVAVRLPRSGVVVSSQGQHLTPLFLLASLPPTSRPVLPLNAPSAIKSALARLSAHSLPA